MAAGGTCRGPGRAHVRRAEGFVSASAAGYYGPDRGDEVLTEESERGQGFLADVYLRALTDSVLSGPVDAVSPEPVRNAEYTRTLGSVLKRPTLPEVPPIGPHLPLGEAGHEFRHPGLVDALGHLLGTATEPAGSPAGEPS